MAIQIYPDYDSLSLHVANEIAAQIADKPDSLLCLAAGDTPKLGYRLLADIVHKEQIDCSRCTFVGLDEWLGVPQDNEGSCFYFLNTHLFTPLGIKRSQIHVFDGMTTDPDKDCRTMDQFIRDGNGIDLMLVGVGMNGHIGFNEPGARENVYAHVVQLDETTRRVGQKYFPRETKLNLGITLGLRHLLESRRAIMAASGLKKAGIIKLALQEEISTDIPASLIRKHKNGVTILDEDAASRLTVI